jgi:hypothetical protein
MSGEVPNHVRKKIRIFLRRQRPTDSILEIEDGFCGAVADCSAPPDNENVSLRSKIESLVGKVAHRVEPLGQAEIVTKGSAQPSSRMFPGFKS